MGDIIMMAEEDYILHGPPLEYDAKYCSVGEFIFDRLRMDPAFVGQIEAHTGHEYTYAEILDRSIRFALWLQDMGIGPGDVVSYVTDNHKEMIIVVYATCFVGATMSCWEINYLITRRQFRSMKDEVAYHIDLTRPKLVVCIAESVKAVQAAAEELHVTPMIVVHGQVPGYLSFDDTLKNHSKTKINNFKCSEVGENDIALIQATSGTTGNPKHSFRSQKSELIGIHCEVPTPKFFATGSVFLACAPLCWVTGMNDVFRGLNDKHRRVLVSHDVDERVIWSFIEEYRVNFAVMAIPSFLRLIHSDGISDYDKSSLRVVYLAGSTLHKWHYKKCTELLPVGCKLLQRNGITEMAGVVSVNTGTNSPGSCGPLIRGGSAKIVDPRTGRTISPHETGELCLKHPKMFQGYYKDPVSTNLAIDSDGWFHTGDLARFDANYELFVIDRLKDILDVNGVTVSPSELEAILLQHPAVRNAGVVGKRVSSIVQHPVAFVVKNPGANVTERELCDFVELRVANENEKLAGGIRFIDQMPLSYAGKVIRWKLREMLESET